MPLCSNSFVASISCQQSAAASQFQAWEHEVQLFRKAAKDADRERTILEKRVQELRATQKQVQQDIEITSESLGRIHRERDMLFKERARLQNVLGQERTQLEDCAKEMEDLKKEGTKKKEDHMREMNDLNNELADLLLKRGDFRLEEMISVDTIPLLLEHYNKLQEATPDSVKDLSTAEELEAAAQFLKEMTEKYISASTKRKTLEETLEKCRARAMKVPMNNNSDNPRFLSKTDLEDLEGAWGHDWSEDAEEEIGEQQNDSSVAANNSIGGPSAADPVHIQLFYGASASNNNKDDSVMMEPSDGDESMDVSQQEMANKAPSAE